MQMQQKEGLAQQNLVGTLKSNTSFSTFINAIDKAGLTASLDGTEQYTLFAPTDEAFSALPAGTLDRLLQPANKDELASLVNYHLVSGRKTTADVGRWQSARTVQGQAAPIKVAEGTLSVGGAHVTRPDIMARNGVIHGIDKVNIPGSQTSLRVGCNGMPAAGRNPRRFFLHQHCRGRRTRLTHRRALPQDGVSRRPDLARKIAIRAQKREARRASHHKFK